MNIHLFGRSGGLPENVRIWEAQLEEVFQPVQPRPAFAHDLKARLMAPPETLIVRHSEEPSQPPAVLKVVGLLSGAVLLVVSVRAILAFIESKGGLQPFKEQLISRRTARLDPV